MYFYCGATLDLLDLTYQIFEPFFAFCESLDLPFPEGDSPVDFILDPERAGALYLDPRATAEVMVLAWIRQARELATAKSDYWPFLGSLAAIKLCHPSSKILNELATLDVAQLCDRMSVDQYAHTVLHQQCFDASCLGVVLDWFQTFPEPPLDVLEYWEMQIATLQQCVHYYGDGNNSEDNK
ncbi:hypothetical protein C8F04DRAFT_302464 [Mycena alexandri]|uniref:Uncharacterized protein n=1 Tax=Mycena alexandri TaxID=1745969 RepID=A0AAD6S5J2_9AGAR|nr:hypothetical protein C8F04DRAFT_302464 [Mycena alexandri]